MTDSEKSLYTKLWYWYLTGQGWHNHGGGEIIMGNMAYCRFQNTAEDLWDCYDNWEDIDKNNIEENDAKQYILELCKKIIALEIKK